MTPQEPAEGQPESADDRYPPGAPAQHWLAWLNERSRGFASLAERGVPAPVVVIALEDGRTFPIAGAARGPLSDWIVFDPYPEGENPAEAMIEPKSGDGLPVTPTQIVVPLARIKSVEIRDNAPPRKRFGWMRGLGFRVGIPGAELSYHAPASGK